MLRATEEKPTAKDNTRCWKTVTPLRSGTRKGYLLSPHLINITLKVLTKIISQEKEIKGIQIGKEQMKLSLFTDDVILHLKNPKDSTKKEKLDWINKFNKVTG